MNPIRTLSDKTGLNLGGLLAAVTIISIVIGGSIGVSNGYQEILRGQEKIIETVQDENNKRSLEHKQTCLGLKSLDQDLRLHIILNASAQSNSDVKVPKFPQVDC